MRSWLLHLALLLQRLTLCGDCHELVVRDTNRFQHFIINVKNLVIDDEEQICLTMSRIKFRHGEIFVAETVWSVQVFRQIGDL